MLAVAPRLSDGRRRVCWAPKKNTKNKKNTKKYKKRKKRAEKKCNLLNGSVKNKTINNIALNKIAKQASEREKQQFFNKTKAKTNFVFASPHDKRQAAAAAEVTATATLAAGLRRWRRRPPFIIIGFIHKNDSGQVSESVLCTNSPCSALSLTQWRNSLEWTNSPSLRCDFLSLPLTLLLRRNELSLVALERKFRVSSDGTVCVCVYIKYVHSEAHARTFIYLCVCVYA